MDLLKYLIILILFSTIVYAEEETINANIDNISINTWIEGDKSYCKVVFNTKHNSNIFDDDDEEGNELFDETINSNDNYTRDEFKIKFRELIDCNDTVLGELTDQCLTYFGNSNISTIVDCEIARTACQRNKEDLNKEYTILENERNNLSEYKTKYEDEERLLDTCNSKNRTCELEKEEKDRKWWWTFGIAIFVSLVAIFRGEPIKKKIDSWFSGKGGVKTPGTHLSEREMEPINIERSREFDEKRGDRFERR